MVALLFKIQESGLNKAAPSVWMGRQLSERSGFGGKCSEKYLKHPPNTQVSEEPFFSAQAANCCTIHEIYDES
ncbi:MAG: hypothetical protein WBK19_20485 [Azonexus sp.]